MRVIVPILAVSVTLVMAGTSRAAVRDPRKCASTPSYCASHAAGRAAVAKVRASVRTVAPVLAHCDQSGPGLLMWRCRLNDGGGHGWNVSVIYRATAAGWRVRATVL